MGRPKPRSRSRLAAALALACLLGCAWWVSRKWAVKPSAGGAPLSAYARSEAQEAEEMKRFRGQDKRDELVKLTENSFFDEGLKPLAGRPVLLAAGVKTWDVKHGEVDESPNMVKFEILQGKGNLEFFTDYIPGRAPSGTNRRQLQTLAMEGYEAFVWLVTDPDSRDEVVVRASLAAQGERAAFIDPQSEVLFHVQPVGMGPEEGEWDVRKVRNRTYLNDSKDHVEIAEHFIFTYPSSIGVYKLDPTAGLYRGNRLRIFRKDPKGTVAEAPDWEEKHTWKWEREKWHTIPPDLQGLLTHVDGEGGNFGILTYTQYDPLYGGQGDDQFRQGRWELGEYLRQETAAGPEDLWTLKTEQEDPNSPIAVEVSRTHHTRLQQDHGMYYWGDTVHWISSTGNLFSIYDLAFKKVLYFQTGAPPPLEDLKTRLEGMPNPLARPSADRPAGDLSRRIGFSFQDITPALEGHFGRMGHPPGPVVTTADPLSSPGSPGFLPDDVILMVNWEQTTSASELQKVLAQIRPKEPATLIFWRHGSYHWSKWRLP